MTPRKIPLTNASSDSSDFETVKSPRHDPNLHTVRTSCALHKTRKRFLTCAPRRVAPPLIRLLAIVFGLRYGTGGSAWQQCIVVVSATRMGPGPRLRHRRRSHLPLPSAPGREGTPARGTRASPRSPVAVVAVAHLALQQRSCCLNKSASARVVHHTPRAPRAAPLRRPPGVALQKSVVQLPGRTPCPRHGVFAPAPLTRVPPGWTPPGAAPPHSAVVYKLGESHQKQRPQPQRLLPPRR